MNFLRRIQTSETGRRYFQLLLLVCAAGAIYPLLYLRQNFETPILLSFGISIDDLGNYYSLLGTIFFLGYLPGGWLADKTSPRVFISLALISTGLLGFIFAQIPSAQYLKFIFVGWGITTGLVFWGALIKGVKMLAKQNEQGKFFGILAGGRGFVEAILATIAITIFARIIGDNESVKENAAHALTNVIYMYSWVCIIIGIFIFFLLEKKIEEKNSTHSKQSKNIIHDLKTVLSYPEVWLVGLIIFCSYHLIWATYSFSAFLQLNYHTTTVTAGTITVAKLWTRPIGGICGGFLGDSFGNTKVLLVAMISAVSAFCIMVFLPQLNNIVFITFITLFVGTMIYAISALFWAIFGNCRIPFEITGLAIGLISLLGYMPDIFIPIINGKILTTYSGIQGYKIYFSYIIIMGCLGVFFTWVLDKRLRNTEQLKLKLRNKIETAPSSIVYTDTVNT